MRVQRPWWAVTVSQILCLHMYVSIKIHAYVQSCLWALPLDCISAGRALTCSIRWRLFKTIAHVYTWTQKSSQYKIMGNLNSKSIACTCTCTCRYWPFVDQSYHFTTDDLGILLLIYYRYFVILLHDYKSGTGSKHQFTTYKLSKSEDAYLQLSSCPSVGNISSKSPYCTFHLSFGKASALTISSASEQLRK